MDPDLLYLIALATDEDDPQPITRDFGDPIQYTYRDWTLDEWADSNCLKLTRFTKAEIHELIHLLRIYEVEYNAAINPQTAELACCVLLRRLAFPCRWLELQELFGRSAGWLSTVFTCVVQHLHDTFSWLLDWHPHLRSYRRLHRFANAVERRCLGRIWGFIDGHFQPFGRPGFNQRWFYSGHAKAHGLKYQAIVTPDGIIYSLYGPYEGKKNDWSIWTESGVIPRLRRMMTAPRPCLYLYGDPAYHCTFGVCAPFLGDALTADQQRFNTELSKVRISVEHAFGDAWRQWTYTVSHRQLHHGNQAVGAFFKVAVLLNNIRCCMGGNQTSAYFGVVPLTPEEYLYPF